MIAMFRMIKGNNRIKREDMFILDGIATRGKYRRKGKIFKNSILNRCINLWKSVNKRGSFQNINVFY